MLAAIAFTGIILVLTTRSHSGLRLPTLRLFVAALLVLGLDAFAFALVSGEVQGICMKVWTESIVAMGMLVVGTCAALAGVAWLFVAQLESIEVPRTEGPNGVCHNAMQLERLLRRSIYGITGLTIFLLATSAHDYVQIAFAERDKPSWLTLVIPLYLSVVLFILALMVLVRRRRWRRESCDADLSAQRSLSTAVNAVLVHALLGMAIVGIATSTQASAWEEVPLSAFLLLLGVALVLPTPILFAIALSVPRLVIPQAAAGPGSERSRATSAPSGDSSPVTPTPRMRVGEGAQND